MKNGQIILDASEQASEKSQKLQIELGKYMQVNRYRLDGETYDMLSKCYARLGNDAHCLNHLLMEHKELLSEQ